VDEARLDRWVWAVRVYRTRSAATDACRGGHVKLNGRTAKPAASVHVGDRIEAKVGPRRRELEVVKVIDTRVGAPLAAECFVDHTPAEPRRDTAAAVPTRDPGSGRPTKKDRRRLDRSRGRR
jgi:ribosome-associated heat shock protein Hsp15